MLTTPAILLLTAATSGFVQSGVVTIDAQEWRNEPRRRLDIHGVRRVQREVRHRYAAPGVYFPTARVTDGSLSPHRPTR